MASHRELAEEALNRYYATTMAYADQVCHARAPGLIPAIDGINRVLAGAGFDMKLVVRCALYNDQVMVTLVGMPSEGASFKMTMTGVELDGAMRAYDVATQHYAVYKRELQLAEKEDQ